MVFNDCHQHKAWHGNGLANPLISMEYNQDGLLQRSNLEVSPTTLTIPSQWSCARLTHAEAVSEVDRLAKILLTGADALCGLYMRICETIRRYSFTDAEIRATLGKYFPPPRVSEFVKIANAPPEVYRRYEAGFIGFRAALAECRGYQINTTEFLKSKKIRRAAERLINLMDGVGEVTVKGRKITVANTVG